jgi:hypothetical protein
MTESRRRESYQYVGDAVSDRLFTLQQISSILDIAFKQLTGWEDRRNTTGFPDAKKLLGKYKLYDIEEVREWKKLWDRVTENMRGKGSKNLRNGHALGRDDASSSSS